MAIRSTRLKCSKHLVFLVLDVQIVNKASGPVRIEFWRCPLNCGYVRANKHQKKPVKPRGQRKSVAYKSHKCDTKASDQQASFGF